MDYPIEQGVPMPNTDTNGKRSKYPFQDMQVGDSFFIAGGKSAGLAATARNWAVRNRVQHRFLVRTVEGGVRVWRVG